MPLDVELLTTSEAAVVADVSVRDVNRLIDEHILPKELYSNEDNRRVKAGACALVRFYYLTANSLTADARKNAILDVCGEAKSNPDVWRIATWRRTKPRWTIRHNFLTVNFDEFVTEILERHDRLEEARQAVVEDPAILNGTPVIKGTRVPVYDVAASLDAGTPLSQIQEAYPSLSKHQIELAQVYAKAMPPRGRPRQIVSHKNATTLKRVRRSRS